MFSLLVPIIMTVLFPTRTYYVACLLQGPRRGGGKMEVGKKKKKEKQNKTKDGGGKIISNV